MATAKTIEVPVKGMDYIECAMHVQPALPRLPNIGILANSSRLLNNKEARS